MDRINFIKNLKDEEFNEILNKCNLSLSYPRNKFGEVFPAVRKEDRYFILIATDSKENNLISKLTTEISKRIPILSNYSSDYIDVMNSKMFLVNNFICYQLFSIDEDEQRNIDLSKSLQNYLEKKFGQDYINALENYQNNKDIEKDLL